jgi:hypothetical protein
MGRISHTNLKIRVVISGIATSKITKNYWSPVRPDCSLRSARSDRVPHRTTSYRNTMSVIASTGAKKGRHTPGTLHSRYIELADCRHYRIGQVALCVSLLLASHSPGSGSGGMRGEHGVVISARARRVERGGPVYEF